MGFRFEDYTVDIERRELRRGGSLMPLEPQAFDLLIYLISHRERVVRKDELIDAIWRGRIVSESALTTRINAVRKAVSDSGEQQRLIRTIPRKGFRFVGSAQEQSNLAEVVGAVTLVTSSRRMSIAVLPFANMSGDPQQDYFADGIVEEITVALGRVPGLLVIARQSSFNFKDKNIDVREVGQQLGARYLVEGTVRRSGNRLRLTAELLDSKDGAQLWAERYERPMEDVFEIQDELTKEIVTALRIRLTDGEQASIWLRSTNDVEAWNYATRGADRIWSGGTAADMAEARLLLEHAVARDPSYAKAMALIALTHYFDIRFNYSKDKEASRHKLVELTAKALALSPEEPYAIWTRSVAESLEGRFMEAVTDARLALSKSPNDAHCWLNLARLLVNAEQPVEAEQAIRHAMRLNPFYPINYLAVLGDALVHQERSQEAFDVFHEIVRRQPNYISAHLHLAGLYSSLGRMDSAREEVAQVLRLDPRYRVEAAASFYLSANNSRKQTFLESLRAAGLPD